MLPKIKRGYWYFLFVIITVGITINTSLVYAQLSCRISDSCDTQQKEIKVLGISNTDQQAHAELPSYTNYINNICCRDTVGYPLGNSKTDKFVKVLNLLSETNSVVEETNKNNYNYGAYLSSPFYDIACEYLQDCAKPSIPDTLNSHTCLASISDDTNAHIGGCDTFTKKVCCKIICKSTETDCQDGIDNDCNGLTDCSDSQCDGGLEGTLKEKDKADFFIAKANVTAKIDLLFNASGITNDLGYYKFRISCGMFNVIAAHKDYITQVKTNIIVNPQSYTNVDFELVQGLSCESDCTLFDENIIRVDCESKNECKFCDIDAETNKRVKEVCSGSQPGWVEEYNATHYVTCPSGCPVPKEGVTATNVKCESGTLVKATRIVIYQGKPVKLVVAVCS